ncbi:MAG: hypothetical protein KME57_09995 [Scytonema hyalinum WJT4-NPBG1]|jgi:hypothetical protein|nr:hypothetical protein [Scytonema hyalinum WJT4-NPBG1]
MFNKSIAFGLLAAGLMIAPTAAFADQSQINTQETVQEGAAFDRSVVNQDSNSSNIQTQTRSERSPRNNNRGRYYDRGRCNAGSQAQDSVQSTRQSAAAEYGSVVDQRSNSRNRQAQASGC